MPACCILGRIAVAGLILVRLGLCFLIVATFNADASETGLTMHGALHKVAAVIIVFCFPVLLFDCSLEPAR